ncbi:hypothetical protein, partial [Clostridium butyricum]
MNNKKQLFIDLQLIYKMFANYLNYKKSNREKNINDENLKRILKFTKTVIYNYLRKREKKINLLLMNIT